LIRCSTSFNLAQKTGRPNSADAAADVAVFRFTLGIPGLDDAQVPRIIGALALLGLAANRFFGGGGGGEGAEASSPLLHLLSSAPPSQIRAEAVAAVLALACVALPTVEGLIADAEPGRGRGAVAALPGSVQAFRVAPSNSKKEEEGENPRSSSSSSASSSSSSSSLREDAAAAELAWSTYALLRNANCCTVVVLAGDDEEKGGGATTTATATRALAVRGALPPAVATSADPLSAAAAAFSSAAAAASLASVFEKGEALYVSDATSLSSGGDRGPWGVLPPGAGCALVQPIFSSGDSDGDGGKKVKVVGLLLLAGDRPRALSVRDRAWARSVARKLAPVVVGSGGGGK
jgi:hypothetical protein